MGFFEEPEPEPGAGKICYLAPGSRLSAPGSLAPSPASPEVDIGAEFGRKKKKWETFLIISLYCILQLKRKLKK